MFLVVVLSVKYNYSMKRSIFELTINKPKLIITIFTFFVVVCIILQFFVGVNFKMADYLPSEAPSTHALEVMEQEFPTAVTNARVMLNDVGIAEALAVKEQLKQTEHVSDVMWLDDVVDIKTPLQTLDSSLVDSYYKDRTALISLSIESSFEMETTQKIRSLIGENNAVSGDAVSTATMQELSSSESLKAIAFLLPIIIIILLFTTRSYWEPVLFLLTIGVAVLLNMGTNIIFGEVSFITFSISPILQMAVSLDYAIFLLHAFEANREQGLEPKPAMLAAIKRSIPVIFASALTTLLGFLALVFMRFTIGADLGINLAKGIAFSLLSVLFFLPALTLASTKLLDKTRHKNLLPKWKGFPKFLYRLRVPTLILVLAIVIPCFIGQSKNSFSYGTGALDRSTRAGQDEQAIVDTFGESTPLVLLVPRGEIVKERDLSAELAAVPRVTGVMSFAYTVGTTIPDGFIDDTILSQFYSDNYARIVVQAATPSEGDDAFAVVEQARALAAKYYGDDALSLGAATSLYDMKQTVSADQTLVNLLAIIAIGVVILLIFKSLSMPLVLLFTIESAIWINLSIPYFQGSIMSYVGFLVISTVQLGATVDYAILFSDHYMQNRKQLSKKEALLKTLGETTSSILISGGILSLAGFMIGIVSTNPLVSELGLLLGRGTLLSVAMVLFVLPALLNVLDPIIRKTTLHSHFLKKEGTK